MTENRKYTSSPFILIAFIFVLMTGCTPSKSAIATALTKTEAARPMDTPASTYTPTHALTSTATNSPTSSPMLDIRVIDVNPQELLLKEADLPVEAGYYRPGADWISHHSNDFYVSQTGAYGQGLVARTGRVDGWWAYYMSGNSLVIAPKVIGDEIVLFRTHEGAMIYFEDKNSNLCNWEKSTIIKGAPMIGDASVSCVNQDLPVSGLRASVVVFVYRNIAHQLSGSDMNREVSYEYMDKIAETLLTRLMAAPLSAQVTFTP